jgi:hypothetical protein
VRGCLDRNLTEKESASLVDKPASRHRSGCSIRFEHGAKLSTRTQRVLARDLERCGLQEWRTAGHTVCTAVESSL